MTTYSDTGLAPNITYPYQVRAYNSAYNLEYSNSVSATTGVDNSVYIGDLNGSSSPGNKNRWDATVTVTVLDAYGNPVSGATVTGV